MEHGAVTLEVGRPLPRHTTVPRKTHFYVGEPAHKRSRAPRRGAPSQSSTHTARVRRPWVSTGTQSRLQPLAPTLHHAHPAAKWPPPPWSLPSLHTFTPSHLTHNLAVELSGCSARRHARPHRATATLWPCRRPRLGLVPTSASFLSPHLISLSSVNRCLLRTRMDQAFHSPTQAGTLFC